MPGFFKRNAIARLAVAACLLTLLGACASGPGVNADGEAQVRPAVAGELVYRQRIALSPEAVADLKLVDTASGQAVARRTLPLQGKQVPIEFALGDATAGYADSETLQLQATIRDGQGNLRWLARVPVEADARDDMKVRLAQLTIDNEALTGSQWQLLRIEGADGSIANARDRAPSTIVFGSNGRFNGTAACNGFFGDYQLRDDGSLQLGNAGATLMACPGDNIATEFLQTLGQVDGYAMDAEHLYLQAGDAIIVLTGGTQS